MKAIKKRIVNQCKGEEKNFLLSTIKKEKVYLEKGDKQAMQILINRVNGLYDGLSDAGQAISQQLIKKIMEDMNTL